MLHPYYTEPGITIYHGDCREVLPDLPTVDLLLTDPPYGLGEARGKNNSRGKLAKPTDYGYSTWDDATIPDELLTSLRHLATYHIIFGGNFYPLPPAPCWLVWDKDNSGDFADCELAWTNPKKATRRLRWRWNGMLQEHMGQYKEERLYPTQKPLAVMKWAISHAPTPCRSLLDPFMGSGTSLLAAQAYGIHAIGIDMREHACEIAVNRLRQGVLQFD